MVGKAKKGYGANGGGMKQLKDYRIRDDGSLIEWFSNSLSPIAYSPLSRPVIT